MYGIIKLSFNKGMYKWNKDLLKIKCFRKMINWILKKFVKLKQILEVGWKSGTILVTIVVRTHWIVSGCWFGSWLRSKLGTTLESTCITELGQLSGTRHGSRTKSTNGEVLGLLLNQSLRDYPC